MTHKEIKKEIHSKLEAALVDLKGQLGDKKFSNRIKKAAKLLSEGLGKEEKPEAPKVAEAKSAPAAKKTVASKAPAKKAADKKAPVKKTIIPVAKKAVKALVTKKKVAPKAK